MRIGILALALATISLAWGVVAQDASGPKPKRAKPPTFESSKTEGIFYSNLFEKGLVGARPADFGAAKSPGAGPSIGPGPAGSNDPPAGGGFAWSKIISSETLQDEIKATKLSIDTFVSTPNAYAAGGNKDARREFSVLAVLFGVVAEFDGDTRFKKEAPAMRDALARVGFNSKVGTVQVYNEAKQRKQDLADLIGGNIPKLPEPEGKANWSKLADRAALMQRLEIGEKRIAPATANKGEFSKSEDRILADAEVMGVIAEAIGREGYDLADDKDYQGHLAKLKKAMHDLAEAVRLKNADAARTAAGMMSQSCTQCHSQFR